MSTYDLFFVLARVVVVEISEEFVELQRDLALELDGFGGLALEICSLFGSSLPLI